MSQLYVDNIKNRTGGAIGAPSGAVVTGVATATQFSGDIVGVAATFSGDVSIGGTLTYEDVTNIDSVGLITARSGINVTGGEILVGSGFSVGQAGVVTATSFVGDITGDVTGGTLVGTALSVSGISTFNSEIRPKGVVENVSAATTYNSASGALVVEMDVRNSTVYTYTIPTGANIGIVSFKNMPADTQNGTTITLITTQNAAGTGNTTAATGIGTNCTVIPFANGVTVAGISTRALVGTATTVTLSDTASDVDFVSFFIHYNGGTNTTASSYKIYATKNGGFRQGSIGV